MQKDGSILITADDFKNGIADSAILGPARVVNLDLHSKKGVIQLSYNIEEESGGEVVGFISHGTINPKTGTAYFGDDDGNVYRRTAGGTWTLLDNRSFACRGIQVFEDYLFFVYNTAGDTVTDRYGPLSGSASWDTAWGVLKNNDTATNVPSIVSTNGIAYFGINNTLTSLSDSTSSGSIVEGALTLLDAYVVSSLEQVGDKLQVGTTTDDNTLAVVFPWDRYSTQFELPINAGLNGVRQLINKDNLLYIVAGARGDVLISNTAQTQSIKKISYLTEDPHGNFNINANAVDTHNGGILFGFGKTAAKYNGPVGVWEYKEKAWSMFTTSNGECNDNEGLKIGCVMSLGADKYLVAWERPNSTLHSSTYGVDVINNNRRRTNYSGYFDSQLYLVGTTLKEKTFNTLDFGLAKPLESNCGVKISYRTNLTDSFTEIDTFAYGTGDKSNNDNLGAIQNFNFPADIPSCTTVQFRIALTSPGLNESTPELVYFKAS